MKLFRILSFVLILIITLLTNQFLAYADEGYIDGNKIIIDGITYENRESSFSKIKTVSAPGISTTYNVLNSSDFYSYSEDDTADIEHSQYSNADGKTVIPEIGSLNGKDILPKILCNTPSSSDCIGIYDLSLATAVGEPVNGEFYGCTPLWQKVNHNGKTYYAPVDDIDYNSAMPALDSGVKLDYSNNPISKSKDVKRSNYVANHNIQYGECGVNMSCAPAVSEFNNILQKKITIDISCNPDITSCVNSEDNKQKKTWKINSDSAKLGLAELSNGFLRLYDVATQSVATGVSLFVCPEATPFLGTSAIANLDSTFIDFGNAGGNFGGALVGKEPKIYQTKGPIRSVVGDTDFMDTVQDAVNTTSLFTYDTPRAIKKIYGGSKIMNNSLKSGVGGKSIKYVTEKTLEYGYSLSQFIYKKITGNDFISAIENNMVD